MSLGFSGLLFCSCVIGLLSCFPLQPTKVSTTQSSHLVGSRLGTISHIHLTCGSRGGIGVHVDQKLWYKFLPWPRLNLGPLTWQSSTQMLDHCAPQCIRYMQLNFLGLTASAFGLLCPLPPGHPIHRFISE